MTRAALRVWLVSFAACLVGCAGGPEPEATEAEPATSSVAETTLSVVIEGAKDVGERDLRAAARRELESFRKNGGRPADLEDAAYAMVKALRQEGFARGDVTFRAEPSLDAIERAVFVVSEGKPFRFGKPTFAPRGDQGEKLTDEVLATFFEFPGSGILGTGDVTYRRTDVEAAMTEVEKAYLLEGYYRVRLGDLDPNFTEHEDHFEANPIITIVPGPLYRMRVNVRAEAVPAEARSDLPDLSKWQDQPYHVRRPAELAAAIRAALFEHGHQLAEVTPKTKVADEDATATVVVEIDPGPRLVLDDIAIDNLTEDARTDPDFILSLFELEPGEVLSQSRIDAVVDRLYRTGLFGRVEAELEPGDSAGDPRPTRIEVHLEELEARSVDFEVGYGSYELLRGGVRYRDRNLFGVGRILDARLRASVRSARAELGVTDPYTLGARNTIVLRGGAEYREEPAFTRQSLDLLLSVRHEFDRTTSLTGGYQLRTSKITDAKAELPPDEEQTVSTRAGLFLTLRHDTRDNPVLPEDGLLATAGVAWSTPALFADLDFVELNVRLTSHHPITDGTVLAWGFRGVTRHILDGTPNLPLQERLYLGGESSVRSFFESELGPTDDDNQPIGGLTAFEAHVELRQRLFGNLHAALFYDVGTVGLDSFDFESPYGHAIGIGLRYLLPIGPARLDFGYNPGARFAADQAWALHFSFGFSF